MKITRERLKECALALLAVLDRESIRSVEDIQRLEGHRFLVPDSDDTIICLQRPSNGGTNARVIEYSIPGSGIAINAVINPALGYSQVIVKTGELIPGYVPFGSDDFENTAQSYRIERGSLIPIREEIERLAELTEETS